MSALLKNNTMSKIRDRRNRNKLKGQLKIDLKAKKFDQVNEVGIDEDQGNSLNEKLGRLTVNTIRQASQGL